MLIAFEADGNTLESFPVWDCDMGKSSTANRVSGPLLRATPITRIQFLTAQIRACQVRLDDAVAQSMAAQVALNEARECLAVAGQALECVLSDSVIQPPAPEPVQMAHPCVIVLGAADMKNAPEDIPSSGAYLANKQLIMCDQKWSGAELL